MPLNLETTKGTQKSIIKNQFLACNYLSGSNTQSSLTIF